MEFREVVRIKTKICHTSQTCAKCPVIKYCYDEYNVFPMEEVDDFERILTEWEEAHTKTYISDLMEKIPNADKTQIVRSMCPESFGYPIQSCLEYGHNCEKCWNTKI